MPKTNLSLSDRIKRRVVVDEVSSCWVWIGAGASSNEYTGTISVNRSARSVRSVAYEVFIGDIPDGLIVMQRCGNIKCINPNHLFCGKRDERIGHPSVIDRFKAKCSDPSENGCILWLGSKTPKGYGHIKAGYGYQTIAHRLSYQLFVGDIPNGLHVLHRCDNPSCVNHEHLFLGTNLDNVTDKVNKGRSFLGSKTPRSKLTDMDVVAIKNALLEGVSYRKLSARFNVHHATIYCIASKKTWKPISLEGL